MSLTSKFVPLAAVIGGFVLLGVDLYLNKVINESMFNALMYSALGGSAAVGFSKYWKK